MEELRILGRSETPPFEIVENSNTAEATRLKYRYLDLRRPELQRNLRMRHEIDVYKRQAEDIKIRIGSAFPYEDETTMDVKGRNLVDGLPKNITISSEEDVYKRQL